MLTLQLEEFMMELKDGSIKHVGTTNKSASVTLYDVGEFEARPFGDERIKLVFADEEGNDVEVALDPEDAATLAEDIGDVSL